jgi:hypothetical protein
MVQNTRVKRALSRKQVGVTPVSNTGIKPRTGDPHQFNTSIDPTKLHYRAGFVWSSIEMRIGLVDFHQITTLKPDLPWALSHFERNQNQIKILNAKSYHSKMN